MMMGVITRSRPASTDTTTTILILARRTDITARSGLTMASSWESARGTDGVGAVAADTGATIGADAAGVTMVTVATDIVAGTDTAVAMVTADMAAAGMATTADITAAGRIRVVDIAGAVDTMAVVTPSVVAAEASTAEQAGSTVEAVASMVEEAADFTVVVADSTAVVEAVDSMVAVEDMAADIDSPQIGFTLGSFYKSAAVSSMLAAASFCGRCGCGDHSFLS